MKNTTAATAIPSAPPAAGSLLDFVSEMVGDRVQEREIEHNGVTRVFHFKQLTAAENEEFQTTLLDKQMRPDATKLRGAVSRLLALALCKPDGSAWATAKEIGQLPHPLREKLRVAALEVSGTSPKKDSEDADDSASS